MRSLEICLSVNTNLFVKLVLSLKPPVTTAERLKVTSVLFFFLILIYLVENYNFTVKVACWVILHWYDKAKQIYNTLRVPCEKYKMVSFTSSIMTNIVLFPSQSRLPVKLICCIAFRSASSYCCLLKSIVIILLCSLK